MKISKGGIAAGLIFILFGLLMAGRAFGLHLNVFFNGWWTLFIIIPCFMGLFEKGDKTVSICGLIIGLLLLLSRQGYFHSWMINRLIIAIIFMVIGISILFRGRLFSRSHNNRYDSTYDRDYKRDQGSYYSSNEDRNTNSGYTNETSQGTYENANAEYQGERTYTDNSYSHESYNQHGTDYHGDDSSRRQNFTTNNNGDRSFSVLLGSRVITFANETFKGAYLSSILGDLTLDLRDAVLEEDAIIEVSAILGGIDIFVPRNIRVAANPNSILGNVDNQSEYYSNGTYDRTIYINGNCILGGVIIK